MIGVSFMKRFWKYYTLVFTFALIAFSAYALLDTFVITRVYSSVEQSANTGANIAAVETAATPQSLSVEIAESGATSYRDENMRISLSTYYENDTTIYVADIQVDSPELLKTAFSQNSYGRNVTAATSDTAADVDAILAINGDNYGSREKGYVIRNGVLYRDTASKGQEDLVIYADGSFEVINESEISAQELIDNGAVQVFSFGPGLIEEGDIIVDADDEVDRAKASNPRTAIGILDENHYVFVVSDGRSTESEGLTLKELALFMQSLGVQYAYNLDGGGSSTMVFLDEVINNPTSGRSDGERAVTDIVFIGY